MLPASGRPAQPSRVRRGELPFDREFRFKTRMVPVDRRDGDKAVPVEVALFPLVRGEPGA
jgi:hypothetical protein